MSDKLLQLFHKHDRYKFPKPNMARNLSDIFPVESDKLFNTDKVENVVNEVLDSHIEENFVYRADECPQLCITLSEEVRKAVKDLEFKRYKLICLVQIFERKNQSINSVARFLCDSERDRYVVVKKEYKSAYIIVSVDDASVIIIIKINREIDGIIDKNIDVKLPELSIQINSEFWGDG